MEYRSMLTAQDLMYFDYDLQVWVMAGIVKDCAHREKAKKAGCCSSHKYAGMGVTEARTQKKNETLTKG